MARNVKITVEETFGKDGAPSKLVYEFDGVDIVQERGLRRVYSFPKQALISIEPNGQEILVIQAWKGCASFDSFIASERVG